MATEARRGGTRGAALADVYVDHMRTTGRLNPRTINAYAAKIRHLDSYCAARGLQIENLTEADLRRYLAHFASESGGSAQQRRAALSGLYSYAREIGLRTDDNPMDAIRPLSRPPAQQRRRPGRLSAKIGRLSERDQMIMSFLRELSEPRPKLGEVFEIDEEPPVGPSVMIKDSRGRSRPLHLTDQARQILDRLGGNLGSQRTLQKHVQKRIGNVTVTELLQGSRAEVRVEMHPELEDRLHSLMAHGQYEEAAKNAFGFLEVRLRDLVGDEHFGRRTIETAFGKSGIHADAFDRDIDRQDFRDLMWGAFGWYLNRLKHGRVSFQDAMQGREVVLLADLLLRELDDVTDTLRLKQLELAPHSERDARITERGVRALSETEFEKWVIRCYRGTYATAEWDHLGIDGWTDGPELPIQVKQQEHVGRPTVDKFETAIERSRKSRGILVAYSFSKRAEEEAERTRQTGRVDVELVTVRDLIRERTE
jgi:hypothetical protein